MSISSQLDVARYLRSEIVKISVTNETSRAEYYIHAQVLRNESPYFEAMENFSEGDNGAVELKEMDPSAFGIVANWFYKETVPGAQSWDGFDMLVKAYGIADRLMMNKCRSEILAWIRDFCDDHYLRPRNVLVVAQLGLPKGSGIVQFATDQLVFEMPRGLRLESQSYVFNGADGDLFAAGGELVVVLMEKMLKAFECLTPKATAESTWWSSPATDTAREYE